MVPHLNDRDQHSDYDAEARRGHRHEQRIPQTLQKQLVPIVPDKGFIDHLFKI